MKDRILFEVKKSTDRQLRITLQEYRQDPVLDVRFYYLDGKSGEWRPTRQGITLTSSDMIEDLMKVLPQASTELISLKSDKCE